MTQIGGPVKNLGGKPSSARGGPQRDLEDPDPGSLVRKTVKTREATACEIQVETEDGSVTATIIIESDGVLFNLRRAQNGQTDIRIRRLLLPEVVPTRVGKLGFRT